MYTLWDIYKITKSSSNMYNQLVATNIIVFVA